MRKLRVISRLPVSIRRAAALSRPLSAASSVPHAAPRVFNAHSTLAPHEVGECHRLCSVSFSDFVCLLAGGRDEGFDNVYLFLTSCVFWREEAEEDADVVCYFAASCVNSV